MHWGGCQYEGRYSQRGSPQSGLSVEYIGRLYLLILISSSPSLRLQQDLGIHSPLGRLTGFPTFPLAVSPPFLSFPFFPFFHFLFFSYGVAMVIVVGLRCSALVQVIADQPFR